MKRYILNISFVNSKLEKNNNIVDRFKTLKEAMSFESIIDSTVEKALIKDTVTNKTIWLKK